MCLAFDVFTLFKSGFFFNLKKNIFAGWENNLLLGKTSVDVSVHMTNVTKQVTVLICSWGTWYSFLLFSSL